MYLRRATPRSRGSGRARDGGRARDRRTARGAHRADAAPAPPRRRAHRGAGVPAAVVALAVRERARAAFDARVRRRQGRARRRRLRGVDDVARPTVTSRRSRSIPPGTGTAIGTRLLLALAREAIARDATALTLEVRLSNKRRAGDVPAVRVRAGRRAQGLLRRHRRGRARHVGVRGRASRRTRGCSTARARRPGTTVFERPKVVVNRVRILGIETSCDETAAAVVDDGRRRAVVGRREPGRSARALRRRRARDREPRARRADRRRDRAGARRSGHRRSTTSTRSPRCTVPGSRARCSSGVSAAKAIALATGLPYVGVHHHEAHIYAALLEDPTLEPPLVTLDRVGRSHAARRDGRPRPLPRARPDRRRRRGRGVRQGRALPRPRLSRAVPRSTALAREGDPTRSRSRARCSTTATTSRSRA